MIQAVIFDCFGVLVSDALEAMLEPMRASDPAKVQRIVDIVTAANRGMIGRDESRAGISQELGMTPEAYSQKIRDGEVKNTQLLEYILTLRPTYKTALLSNTSSQGLEVRFTPDELAAHFDVVIASGVIGYAKPAAQAYEITADRLAVRLDECIMIDDREDYCAGAHGVGMRAIRYTSFNQMRAELERLL